MQDRLTGEQPDFFTEEFMTQPVWTLSVDLQTKTAVFQSGLADAARSARGSFNDIKSSAKEMGSSMSGSMREARGSLMLIEERLGVHIPRELNTLIASIPGIGAAFETLLPIVGAVFAVGLIANFVEAHEKAAKAIADGWKGIGSTFHDTMANLDDELIQAQIKSDELAGHTLTAVQLQLQLINNQTLSGIIGEFKKAETEADNLLKKMDSNWFMKFLGSVDTGPAQQALLKVREGLDAIRQAGGKDETPRSIALLTKAAQDAQAEFDKLREKQREAAGVLKDSPQDKFLAAHLTDQEKEWQNVATVLREQTIEAKERFKTAEVKEGTVTTEEAQKTEHAWDRAFASLTKRIGDARTKAQESAAAIAEAQMKATEAVAKLGENYTLDVNLNKKRVDPGAAEDAAREEAEHARAMGHLQIAAEKENAQLRLSAKHVLDQDIIDAEIATADAVYKNESDALKRQADALEKGGRDYENKLKQIQNKQVELTRQHENEVTAIKDKAEMERNARILSAEKRLNETLAHGLSQSITNQESWGKMMNSVGSQVASGMLENAIKAIMMDDMTKPHDAAAAARKAFLAGMHFPFPANLVMAPALGAMAFASVMAFESGGIVPGVEAGDVVPARLTPGEAVLPKALTEQLTNAAKFGRTGDSSGDVHVHVTHHSTIHALDSDGMEHVLSKHAGAIAKHVNNHVRRMNKR